MHRHEEGNCEWDKGTTGNEEMYNQSRVRLSVDWTETPSSHNVIFKYLIKKELKTEKNLISIWPFFSRVSVGITVDAPVTAVSNKTNNIQCFKDT